MAATAGKRAKKSSGEEHPDAASGNADEHIVPEARLIAALVNEIARGRARHRALLDLLERSGAIEMADYIAEYRTTEARDFMPFVDLLLLSKGQFAEKHPAWIEENVARFGYDGSSRPQLAVQRQARVAEAPAALASSANTNTKVRTRKVK